MSYKVVHINPLDHNMHLAKVFFTFSSSSFAFKKPKSISAQSIKELASCLFLTSQILIGPYVSRHKSFTKHAK